MGTVAWVRQRPVSLVHSRARPQEGASCDDRCVRHGVAGVLDARPSIAYGQSEIQFSLLGMLRVRSFLARQPCNVAARMRISQMVLGASPCEGTRAPFHSPFNLVCSFPSSGLAGFIFRIADSICVGFVPPGLRLYSPTRSCGRSLFVDAQGRGSNLNIFLSRSK